MHEQRRRIHHEADVVVVGAGIFGCAISYALARQGRSVLLLERSMKEPDRIVGELLQPGGVSALEKLGLAHCLDDIDAIRVDGYKIVYHGQEVAIPYPRDVARTVPVESTICEKSAANEQAKRPEGRSFHHGRFIRRLREACLLQPNITVVETTATSTISSTVSSQILGVNCLTINPETGMKETDYYFGSLTIISDGYASLFRKEYHPLKPVVKSKFYALELIDCVLPLANHGCVILSDTAPVLLYQIGTHETRALIDVPEGTPSATPAAGGVRNHLHNVVYPMLPACVQPSFQAALTELGTKIPRSMPNSFLPPSTQGQIPGMVLLGDAMNMRHPLTGGGMTVAFNDALLLSDLLSPAKIENLQDTEAIRSAMSTFHWRRKSLSSIINILAQALYSLFAANDTQLKALQAGCFAYFQRGGNCIDGPVGLLAGIIRQPLVLVYHFFAVAVLAIYMVMVQTIGNIMGIWKLPLAFGQSVSVFYKACGVLFPYIFAELRR